MRSVRIQECVDVYLATLELTVKHAVLLTSGTPTVVKCVRVTQMAAVTPPPESAPATQTAGVLCVSTPANVPAMATATPSTETAAVTKAGGRPPALNRVSVSVGDPWAPAVTS